MTQRLPEPDRATVANAAMLLSDLSPAAAADGMRMIKEGVYEGLLRNGWHYRDAAVFTVIFCEQITARLHQIADAAGRLHWTTEGNVLNIGHSQRERHCGFSHATAV